MPLGRGPHEYPARRENPRHRPGLHGRQGDVPREGNDPVRHQRRGRRHAREGRHHPSRPARVRHREGSGGEHRSRGEPHPRPRAVLRRRHHGSRGRGDPAGRDHHGRRPRPGHDDREAVPVALLEGTAHHADRAELRRGDQCGPGDDGDHARPHLRPRRGRRGHALRHAGLRGGVPDASARHRHHDQRRHRRRSDQRQLVRRHAGPVRAGPGDRSGDDDRRDRRATGSGRRRIREGAHDEAGDRLRGRAHRSQGPPHGARRRDHLRVRRHGGGEGRDHAVRRPRRRAEPGGAREGGGGGARTPAVTARDGPAVTRPTVIVTRRLPVPVEERLAAQFDARLNRDDHPFTAAELQDALRGADALLPTVTDRLNAAVLATEPLRAKILANYGVGFNHIDVNAAKTRGLVVTNTPDVLTDDTADDAVMLMLMVARRAGEGERQVRAGAWTGWSPTHLLGTKVSGKTLGLIGLGRIGRAVARRAHHGFGMRVIFHDPYPPPPAVAAELGAEPKASVDEVLREADFVSLHSPATPETRHLIDARRLALMKRGAFLINTARGDIVDEAALVEALQRGLERVLRGERLDAGASPELVARAIQAQGMWFQLLSIAEQNAAMRQRRQSEVDRGYDQLRGTFAQVIAAVAAAGIPADEVRATVASLRVRPVITAHPTEAKRVTVLEKHRRIYRRLVDLEAPRWTPRERGALIDNLRTEIELLWLTGELRLEKPTVEQELAWGLYFVTENLFDVVPELRSEEHTSELQSLAYLVCRLLLEKKKLTRNYNLATDNANHKCVAH